MYASGHFHKECQFGWYRRSLRFCPIYGAEAFFNSSSAAQSKNLVKEKEKKYEEAEGTLKDCYEKRKESFGENHDDTLTVREWLERTLEALK